jgi:hypothetical protein
MITQYHCPMHHIFQPVCSKCQGAKVAYYRPKQTLAEFLDAEPEESPIEQLAGFAPIARARHTDPETSHESAALKDQSKLWQQIHEYLQHNGPATEERVLTGIGLEQRSSGSSAFAQMERAKLVVNMADALGSKLKLKNTSGRWAMVRGLPEHQADPAVVASIASQMSASRK